MSLSINPEHPTGIHPSNILIRAVSYPLQPCSQYDRIVHDQWIPIPTDQTLYHSQQLVVTTAYLCRASVKVLKITGCINSMGMAEFPKLFGRQLLIQAFIWGRNSKQTLKKLFQDMHTLLPEACKGQKLMQTLLVNNCCQGVKEEECDHLTDTSQSRPWFGRKTFSSCSSFHMQLSA